MTGSTGDDEFRWLPDVAAEVGAAWDGSLEVRRFHPHGSPARNAAVADVVCFGTPVVYPGEYAESRTRLLHDLSRGTSAKKPRSARAGCSVPSSSSRRGHWASKE